MDVTVSIMHYLIQANFVNIVIVAFLYIFLFTSTTLDKRKKKIFLTGTVCVTVLIFADAADFYFQQYETPTIWRYITSATGYSLRAAVIMFMLFISEKLSRKKKWLLFIPLTLNALLAYCSIFNKVMFYFDETNEFHRGPVGLMPFIACALYLVILILQSVNMYRLGNRREASVIFLIAVMACLGVLMETGFKFKFLNNGIAATSIVFYYLFMNTQTYKRDALTGALNRHAFYLDAEHMAKHSLAIVSIDLNNLKEINDVQGHDMGDKAILAVTKTVFGQIPANYQFYRMGGDEFVILCPESKAEAVQPMMDAIVNVVEKQGYQLAWGMAEYKPGMNFAEQLRLSDEMMYNQKAKMKGQK